MAVIHENPCDLFSPFTIQMVSTKRFLEAQGSGGGPNCKAKKIRGKTCKQNSFKKICIFDRNQADMERSPLVPLILKLKFLQCKDSVAEKF